MSDDDKLRHYTLVTKTVLIFGLALLGWLITIGALLWWLL